MTGKTQADRDDDTMNDDERRHEDVDTQHDQQGFRNNYCSGHLLTIYCILYGHLFKCPVKNRAIIEWAFMRRSHFIGIRPN